MSAQAFNARDHFNAGTSAVCFKCGYTDGHTWSSDFLMSGGYAPTGFCCRWCAFPDLYDDRPQAAEPGEDAQATKGTGS